MELRLDDVLVYGREFDELVKYFKIVLSVLKKYRATLKLKKCHWFRKRTEFVGVDVTHEGNKPAESKIQAFLNLKQPETWHDLCMLIGAFGFYAKWLPNYELEILPWREILAQQPSPKEEAVKQEPIASLWKKEHDALLDHLKESVVKGPVLQRPDHSRRFYLKTDWSRLDIGVALCQAEDTPEANAAEQRENDGGKCEFDTSLSKGPRLRPIAFFARKTTSKMERSLHSFVGEASAIMWGLRKCQKWLVGRSFTIL